MIIFVFALVCVFRRFMFQPKFILWDSANTQFGSTTWWDTWPRIRRRATLCRRGRASSKKRRRDAAAVAAVREESHQDLAPRPRPDLAPRPRPDLAPRPRPDRDGSSQCSGQQFHVATARSASEACLADQVKSRPTA